MSGCVIGHATRLIHVLPMIFDRLTATLQTSFAGRPSGRLEHKPDKESANLKVPKSSA
jgi:hypothetical protein